LFLLNALSSVDVEQRNTIMNEVNEVCFIVFIYLPMKYILYTTYIYVYYNYIHIYICIYLYIYIYNT